MADDEDDAPAPPQPAAAEEDKKAATAGGAPKATGHVATKDAKPTGADRNKSIAGDRKSMAPGERKSQDRRSMSINMLRGSDARYSMDGHLIPAIKPGQRQYQATYRLESQAPVKPDTLYQLTKYAVESAVNANALVDYNPKRSNRFCQTLAREIQRSIASEGFERFRIIAIVQLSECTNQSAWSKMGFLWDADADMWSTYYHEAQKFVISATVLCVYYE